MAIPKKIKKKVIENICDGLPGKDETSETIVTIRV